MPDEGVYLFCLCRPGATLTLALRADDAGGDAKLGGFAHVEERTIGAVAAACCRVPLADFTGPQAEERFRNPAWVVEQAFAHGRVIEKVRTRSSVLPIHFGTVFTSAECLIELVSRHHETITRFLDAMVDVHEWAVQVFIDVRQAEDWLMSGDPELAEHRRQLPENPGVRYFREKKLRGEARKRIKQLRSNIAEQLRTQLRATGLPIVFQPLRSPDETGKEMILHAVCLIPSHDTEASLARITAICADRSEQGATLKTSGPWPPYHFCPTLGEPRE